MKSNIKWIAFFAVFCAVCLAVWFAGSRSRVGTTAVIRHGNKVIRTIDLSRITEPVEFTVEDENGGRNTVRAEHGRIAVIDADCPDKVCVHQGYIENGAAPIVCLPHKLTVTITGRNDGVDAVAGGN